MKVRGVAYITKATPLQTLYNTIKKTILIPPWILG